MANETMVGKITLKEKSATASMGTSDSKSAKAIDNMATRMEKKLEKLLGDFKPTSGGSSTRENIVSGLGIGAGISAMTAGINLIVDAVSDLPVITGIMKLLKVILMLLFMPLIPILKPVLQLLSEMAKIMSPVMKSISDTLSKLFSGDISGFLMEIFTSVIPQLANALYQWILKLGEMVFSMVLAGLKFLADIGIWIWENILMPAWNGLVAGIKWLWDNALKPAWDVIVNGLTWVWENALKPVWDTFVLGIQTIWELLQDAWALIVVGLEWVWNNVLKPVWDTISSALQTAWDSMKEVWDGIIGSLKGVWDKIVALWDKINIFKHKDSNSGNSTSSTTVEDAIIAPGGKVITTDPADYLIATKNPRSLASGTTININIDRPQVTSQNDIKALVKAIEQELYKSQRRYNSYT